MAACVGVFDAGVQIAERNAALRRALAVSVCLLYLLFLVYFGTECWYWLQKSRAAS
jgi:hypothetical protein